MMMQKILTSFYSDFVLKFNQNLQQYLQKAFLEIEDKNFKKALLHSMGFGKRIRPFLSYLVFVTLGGNKEDFVFAPAIALEIMHNYSLVHDDLPAIDNDDYRRGELTCHKKFGEAMAILVGDALQTESFKCLLNSNITAETKLELVSTLANASGIGGMAEGQVQDMFFCPTQNTTEEQIINIAFLKTAKLIQASCLFGAIMQKKDLQAVANFGKNLGIIFQLVNDLIDIKGTKKGSGKEINKDKKKPTIANIYGVEKLEEMIEELKSKVIKTYQIFGKDDILITDLLEFIVNRKS